MKLKLKADPTFKATVGIPIAGGEPAPVLFTFKHRTKDEHEKFVTEESPKMSDLELVLAVAEGWDLEDAFTRENVELLLQNYHRAGPVIAIAYTNELMAAKLGN
jgi:hypothetical protein